MSEKTVRESASEYSELILPNDANSLGTLFGGKLMQLVDLAAAIAAARHARCAIVTASVDSMTFLHPVKIGQLVVLKSAVNRVFRTSMEIGVRVEVEDLMTGDRRHVSSAYLTFVALDKESHRVELPQVKPEGESELRRWEEAALRREFRLEMRERALQREKKG